MGDHVKASGGGFRAGFARAQQYAKAITTGVGALTSAGLFVALPSPYDVWLGLGTALLTTFATYKVPNAKPTEPDDPAG